jgi:adenine-specific DNA methylase
MRLYALEYYCPSCKKRRYKRAADADILLFKEAKAEWMALKDALPIPHQEIAPGDKTKELLNHGITTFADMFNERQLLSLGKLLNNILQISDENIREFFLITFSTALEYQNLLCEYHRKNHYIYNLYRKHAYVNALNPVENNVWGARYGTGTFKNFFAKTIRIKEYCQTPYEYYITPSGESKKQVMNRPIRGNVVSSYQNMGRVEKGSRSNSVLLYCSSSQSIDLQSNTIDLVITDPPYAGNVQYGELADFYYVWLRLGLKDTYPWFQTPLSPKEAEIITNVTRKKTGKDYQKDLSSVFNEAKRVLKPKGLLVFTFHHKKVDAWEVMTQSILDNGFYIVAVYPVWSEMKTSTQIRGKASIEFDAIFVCKQRESTPEKITWSQLLPKIEQETAEKIAEISTLPLQRKIRKEDRLVVRFGVGLRHYSLHYPHVYLDGSSFPLQKVLEKLADSLT